MKPDPLRTFGIGRLPARGTKRRSAVDSRGSHADPYCAFKDDRERRFALVSRDVRIVACRLVAAVALVILAVNAPAGTVIEVIARTLGRF